MNVTPFLIAAGVGFVLSFLGGLIGGVGLGEIILRALFSAVLFGAGAFGLGILLQNFFPELFESSEQATVGENGDQVNMKVGSESEYEMPPAAGVGDNFAQEIEPQEEPSDEEILSRESDELGDMDEFGSDGSFQNSQNLGSSNIGFSSMGSDDDKDGVSLEGIDDDPLTLAKAVQSVLKKDSD
jgi:hypothetical protein